MAVAVAAVTSSVVVIVSCFVTRYSPPVKRPSMLLQVASPRRRPVDPWTRGRLDLRGGRRAFCSRNFLACYLEGQRVAHGAFRQRQMSKIHDWLDKVETPRFRSCKARAAQRSISFKLVSLTYFRRGAAPNIPPRPPGLHAFPSPSC